ncbi:MAG TPA: ATP-binding protein [Bryobacteraceae bacterium]|jgi:transitional endoplasmic reticulum ATPase|nr:ATP-binding protein [Bryobacteraceae bacterium]
MRELPHSRNLPAWGVIAVLALSCALFIGTHLFGNNHQSLANWVLTSWPTLVALAVGVFLLEAGPLRSLPLPLRKVITLIGYAFCFLAFFAVLPSLGLPKTVMTPVALITAGAFFFFTVVKLGGLFGGLRLTRRVPMTQRLDGTSSLEDGLQSKTPAVRFSDIGGLDSAKQQILQLARGRLSARPFEKQGIVQNGILLYGPQGTGKTLLAEATAGELGLKYIYVSGVALNGMWIGETENNIRRVFSEAARGRTLLFLDEIDALGATRQQQTGASVSGTRVFNNTTIQLMQCIDQYRRVPGLLIMAATNSLDSLDPALIREGRFDLKVRLDLPTESERREILAALLRKRGADFHVETWARMTSGYSPAKLNALIDRAASIAMVAGEPFREKHLEEAFGASGGKDRPLIQPVQWEDLIVEPAVEEELRLLVRQLKIRTGAAVPVPTGVLLAGPPGTGKTMIARLLATQTSRSFYPVTAADLLGSGQGDSVKRLAGLFARAKEHSPSIIFFDELDGLFGSTHTFGSSHDTQFIEQALIEISRIEPSHQVLLVGATNHPDRLDSRMIRGGRFSEKIEITVPGPANRERLLRKLLAGTGSAVSLSQLVEKTAGMAPADIEAIVQAARRFAFGRSDRDDRLPPLEPIDFERAIERVHPARFDEPLRCV